MPTATETPPLNLRMAVEADVPAIRRFVLELAAFEELSEQVTATEQDLRKWLFGARPYAEVVIAERAEPQGFALFFHNYSTFLGRPGIHLEDLYVAPAARGQGVGRALVGYLARLAVERNCGRLEWAVLDWNRKAVAFYRSLGAEAMDDWTVYRLTGGALERVAAAVQR